MRSLQVKFSALVVGLLVLACVGLVMMATGHERGALEAEVLKRAESLAKNLADDAKIPLLEQDELALDVLVRHADFGGGLTALRVIGPDGKIVASLVPDERGTKRLLRTKDRPNSIDPSSPWKWTPPRGHTHQLAFPMLYKLQGDEIQEDEAQIYLGEVQIQLDLDLLVEPVVTENRRQLSWWAVVVVILGVGAGLGFVALLVGPIRRLRSGVERLAEGDLATRVPPTSRDEVGELTRAFNAMGESLQQKERIQQAFGRFASDYVLNTLLENPDDAALQGAEREVTVLFADIRSFTRLSEGMKARDVVALLNDVFQIASDLILSHGGTIDKFIGDSVMAYFGAPVPTSDHAIEAVTAAIDLERAIAERNQRLDGSGHPVEMGIGIHTGAVVVGTIGSDRRSDFTAIGDAVNVAHRLEKLARPGEILVSEAVQRRVRGAVKLRFQGERQLSGRVEPVHVYSVDSSVPTQEGTEGASAE